jgi:hypothetical protein
LRRFDLEHILRACGEVTKQRQIVVIGSQSVLGAFPDAPPALLRSMEADVYPLRRPELADLIDGAIGEGSHFHQTYGYYAQGVGPETAVLPKGWRSRLVSVVGPNTSGTEGLCLEVHDLAIAKYVAGREKDLAFTRELARHHMTEHHVLEQRSMATKLGKAMRDVVAARIERDFVVQPGRPPKARGRT